MNVPDDNPDAAVLAALRKGIHRPSVPFLYTVGLTLVAGAMILLPLCYLALVGAVGYGVYWHATHDLWWLTGHGGARVWIVKFIAYAGLLVVGILIVFFLLKPLFARRPKHAQPLALHPGAEPRLYAFIEAICTAVGAPKPRRIDLDCHLNASAAFRRGYLSFLGGDLVLTLGLPLVANLTVSELGGVIAHEFGHFTQGLAMRLGYVISRVNLWFARVVHERDAWDVALAELGESPGDWRIGLVVWTAQLGVGLSRLFLRMLMAVGIALSGFLSRQMEFHADACDIRLAGSENFERTTRKLATLSAALGRTYTGVRTGWNQSGRVPDNLPELLRRVHDDLPDAAVAQIQDTLGLGRARWFDTHPSPAERIRQARSAAQPGILLDDRPATALFENFDIPARQVTELHYADDIGLQLTPEALLPLAPVQAGDDAVASTLPARSYRELSAPPLESSLLLDAAEILLPLPLSPLDLSSADPPDPSELLALIGQLESVRLQIAALAAQTRPADSADKQSGFDTVPEVSSTDPADLPVSPQRHAAHEVIEATSRRLQLGLLLSAPTLDAGEAEQIQRQFDWLRAAHDEFHAWGFLARQASRLADEASRAIATASGDPGEDFKSAFEARIQALKQWRTALSIQPPIFPEITGAPRKLRVGIHANSLRDLDVLSREASNWLQCYRTTLTELWSVAGREELRLSA